MYDDDFAGADADALAMLGGYDGAVSGPGLDWVGATAPMNFMGPKPQAINPQFMQLAQKGIQAAKFAKQVEKGRKLRQAALAGLIPQVMLPISSAVDVPATSAATLSTQPGVPMRVTDLQVAGSIAPFFAILSITAARMNMVAGSGGRVPAECFVPDAKHPPIENPILGAGAPIVMNVENLDAAAHPFIASFWGVDLTPASARLV